MPTSNMRGKKLIILGFTSIVILFVLYGRYQNSELLTPSAIDTIQRIAYLFYVILVVAFGAIALGMYHYHRDKVEKKQKDLSTIIALVTWNPKSRKIFILTFITYGIFFSMISGMLVYQPDINVVERLGVDIPSGFVAPCCGNPGYMPEIVVYLTEHVGLKIIPINFVLQIIVSYLVALNT